MLNGTIFKDHLVVTNKSKTSLTPDYGRSDNETINRSEITDHIRLNDDQDLEVKIDTNGMVIESTPKTIKFSNTNSSDSKHKVDVNIQVEGPSVADAPDEMESSKIDTIAPTGISSSSTELSNDRTNTFSTNSTTSHNFTTDTSSFGTQAPKGAIHPALSGEEDKSVIIMAEGIEKASDDNMYIKEPIVVDVQDDMESSKIGTIATTGISNSHRDLSNDLINDDVEIDASSNNLTTDTPAVVTHAPIEARHSVLTDEKDKLEEIRVKDIEKATTQNAFGSDQNENEDTIIVEPPFRPCRNEINCHQGTSESLLS